MTRDHALDFAKGLLVATMVVYHWMNFTWEPVGRVNEYFRFLTPAFIFLAGWTIATYYPEKYGDTPQLFRRLSLRGLQLLGFFLAINFLSRVVLDWRGNPFRTEWSSPGKDLFGIFVSGNSELMSFHILLPISMLLLLAGEGPRLASRRRRAALWLIGGAIVLSQIFAVLPSRNANLISFGFLGQLAGTSRHLWAPLLPRTSLLLPAGLIIHVLVVSWLGSPYIVQVLATPLYVAVFHAIGRAWTGTSHIAASLAWLGRRSLAGYVVHISALHVLVQLLGPRRAEPAVALFILVLVCIATACTVYILDWLQRALKRRARPQPT